MAVCPQDAIIIKDVAEIIIEKCIGCRICERVCPDGLIKIPEKFQGKSDISEKRDCNGK